MTQTAPHELGMTFASAFPPDGYKLLAKCDVLQYQGRAGDGGVETANAIARVCWDFCAMYR